ncbi:MAG: HEAT repeat domain-containing protein [Elusimicrobiales bacterium]|nr:HEAT repeat domain-containing protein [Elusimicrobiales bacterium]MCK5583040.1 HEAT repeat domain-containing protein [Elusimicrobiales bacterium]
MKKYLIISILILLAQGSYAQNAEFLKLSSNIKSIDIGSLQDKAEMPLLASLASIKEENSVPVNDLEFSKEYVLQQIMAETWDLVENIDSIILFPKKIMGDARLYILTRFFEETYNYSLVNKSAGASVDRLALINAIWALGELGNSASVKTIIKAFPSADQTMRLNMMAALGKIKSPQASKELNKIMIDGGNEEMSFIEAGDIVFRKGYFGLLNPIVKAQSVGHVAVYVGMENGEPMVIEAWTSMRKASLRKYIGNWPFYGNYTTYPKPTMEQRNKIVDYATAQLGKPFSILHLSQKGSEKFDCVGLAEAAYEAAGLNPTPDELEIGWGWPLTPTEQYENVFPNFK